MPRKLTVLLPLIAAVVGWTYWQKSPVAPPGNAPTARAPLPPVRPSEAVRIASFNIQVFGEEKLAKPKVVAVLAQIIRNFDVIAIQEVRAKDANFIDRFLQIVNAAGVPYDRVVGPRLGRTDSKEQYAYLFDTTRLELDPVSVYTVKDPDDLLHREPLVAGFRTRGAPPNEAFTFTLINIHTDPDEVDREVNVLDDVFRAVRDDGRGEDDVILLGDLNADEAHLGQLGALPYVGYHISGVPTNTRGTHTYDNLLFDRRATTEYLGRGSVLDVMRHFNLTQAEALEVSDHLPLWAEFSVYEGGRPGNIATRPAN